MTKNMFIFIFCSPSNKAAQKNVNATRENGSFDANIRRNFVDAYAICRKQYIVM